MADFPEILTTEQAAEYLNIGMTTLLTETRAGTIPATKIGNQWRYSRAALERYVATGEKPADRERIMRLENELANLKEMQIKASLKRGEIISAKMQQSDPDSIAELEGKIVALSDYSTSLFDRIEALKAEISQTKRS